MERKNCWETYSADDLTGLEAVASEYKAFLSECKTERECVAYICNHAKEAGFVELGERLGSDAPLACGEKIFVNYMDKAAYLFVIGKDHLEAGMNYIGAHIDSPRLDLKQNPLYEEKELAYLDTHYYGGVKKYQWVTIPLALHGLVAKKDGSRLNIVIGEDPADPVLCISDLLIHLSQEQMVKPASNVIEGENLDVLVGSKPLILTDEEPVKDPVKALVLSILKEKYDFEEEDFLSAEFEVVPAGPARDLGLDRALILGYGHDDRCCAFAQYRAVMNIVEEGIVPKRTIIAHFTDKEEVGSIGATGSHSMVLENTIAELCALEACKKTPLELKIRRCLSNSCVLSADVSSVLDPLYASAYAKNNAAMLGHGITFLKFTGSRGKSGANDANAEYLGKLRKVLDIDHVNFQTAEIGRVDLGGGGTIAFIIASYGCEVIDCGIPVMSMHAPGEVISKADLYEAVKCYRSFYINMYH